MKILIYGINFAPEPVGAGRYSSELAAWLAASGHDVRVITALPYYPQWKIAPEYPAWKYTSETWKGVKIWRAPLWVPSKPSGTKRVLHLLSFAALSTPLLLRQLIWRPHVVWMVAPAFACAPAAWLTARSVGAKAWLHVQDYEIDVAYEMGMLRGKWSRRFVSALERWLFRRFDRVSSISNAMVTRAVDNKGVPQEKALTLPNWVNVNTIKPLEGESRYRKELAIPQHAVVALYSGSMGPKHGVSLLARAALQLRDSHPNLYFVFCGEGADKARLAQLCGSHPNIRLLPLQPYERLPELLGMADMHLLPQKPGAADLVMPSKLTGMLSSGRPIVATALPGSELACVVKSCGEVVPPENDTAFALAIDHLASDWRRRRELGCRARAYAEAHLASDTVLSRFEHELERISGFGPLGAQWDAGR